MRTDSADRGGERELFFYQFYRRVVVALGDEFYVTLTVGSCRAVQRAGPFAVAVVVAHQKLESDLAGTLYSVRVRVYYHSVRRLGGAGAEQLRGTLDLDRAKTARAVDLYDVALAESRYLDTGGLRRREDSRALGTGNFYSVNGKFDLVHYRLSFQSTFTAPNLHIVLH